MKIFFVSVILAVFFTFLFTVVTAERKTTAGFPKLFALLLFPIWAANIWLPEFGPITQGVSWLSFAVYAAVISILVWAAIPDRLPSANFTNNIVEPSYENKQWVRGVNYLFGSLLIISVVAIFLHFLFKMPRIERFVF